MKTYVWYFNEVFLKERVQALKQFPISPWNTEMGINRSTDYFCEQCEEMQCKKEQWGNGEFDSVDGLRLRLLYFLKRQSKPLELVIEK